mgnify:CR=1 FL=1
MPISAFSTGCHCDCCLIYESRYCEFIADNFPDDHASGGALNLSGVFDDVESWTYQRDVCFSDRGDCIATTDTRSGLKYSPNTYIKGVESAGPSNNRAIILNPLEQFQWYTLMSFMKCEWCTGDETNALWFCFDYQDTDNWLALEIEYEPDFDTSPGSPDRIFLIQLWENVAGTIQLVDSTESAEVIELGAGNNQVDVFIEITVESRNEGGNLVLLNMGVIGAGSVAVGYRFTPINGGKVGWITRFASQAEVGDAGCTVSGDGVYNKHQQIYKTAICYLAFDKEGCCSAQPPRPPNLCCDNCSDVFPDPYHTGEFDVTISGFSDSDDCVNCDFINDTFTLQCGFTSRLCESGIHDDPDGIDHTRNICYWELPFSDYSETRGCTTIEEDTPSGYFIEKSWYWTGLKLIKYPITDGSVQSDTWRLHMFYRMEVEVYHIVLDADGNPVRRGGGLSYKCHGLYYEYTPTVHPSPCLLETTDSFSLTNNIGSITVNAPPILSGLPGVTATTTFSDWCDSDGTVTIEATEV